MLSNFERMLVYGSYCLDKQKVIESFIKIKDEIQQMTSHSETSVILDKLFQRRMAELGL